MQMSWWEKKEWAQKMQFHLNMDFVALFKWVLDKAYSLLGQDGKDTFQPR